MTLPPDRDSSGRFVKPESDSPLPSDKNIHPISKLLFGWVESPRTPLLLLLIVALISASLIVADLFIDRHEYEYTHFAESTGFYAFWGFTAFALAVLSGWPLGKLLRRDEDYYGEADTTPDDVEQDS